MSDNAFQLLTLGRLTLLTPDGREEESLATQRRKLALLAVVAMAGRPISRDVLLEMFWGDQDEARARHSLSNALSHLRRILGRDSIVPHQADVALRAQLALTVDAHELARAVEAGETGRAVALYEGTFLEGIYVDGSPTFEQWVDRERARTEGLFLRAVQAEGARLVALGDHEAAAMVGARWLAAEPLSTDGALLRLRALTASGTRDADRRALAAYDALAVMLQEEFGRRPAREVVAEARAIAERLERSDATGEFRVPAALLEMDDVPLVRTPPPAAVATAAGVIADPPAPPPPAPVRASRWRAVGWGLVALFLLGVAAWRRGLLTIHVDRSDAPATGAVPTLAIIDIIPPPGDSSAWLADGLVRMMAARLASVPGIELIAPERVDDVRRRAGLDRATLPPDERLLDIGRRLGATLVVSGSIGRSDAGLTAVLDLRETAGRRAHPTATVSAPTLVLLAERAAVRLLAAAGREGSTVELAPVETDNLEAYASYIRYLRLWSEGNFQEAVSALDAAIALDSGFVTALRARATAAYLMQTDRETRLRLLAAFKRVEHRATEWDRMLLAAQTAHQAGGDDQKGEQAARALVARFPRDPRAYDWLASVYYAHGRFEEADRVLRQQVALDSLAVGAGTGPCVPCQAYTLLVGVRLAAGDRAGALEAARAFRAVAPDIPNARVMELAVLVAQERWDEAIAAARALVTLDHESTAARALYLRTLISAGRLAAADSGIETLRREPSREDRLAANELRMTIERERGRFRASNAAIDAILREIPEGYWVNIVKRDNLSRIGDIAGARALATGTYEPLTRRPGTEPLVEALEGDLMRAFAWEKATLADAIRARADTTELLALADTLERFAPRSYYSRDWRLHHHVRGLVALRAGRYAEAVDHLTEAKWGPSGWTRTNIEIARAELLLERPERALAVLREARAAPLDAMGRYVTRSELDWWMAKAHAAAGRMDSARVYRDRVRSAWQQAEPEAKRMLADLRGIP